MNGSLIFSPYHKTSLIPYPYISVSDFCHFLQDGMAFPDGSVVKNLPAMQKMPKTQARSLGKEDALEEGMTTHSSILTWRVPWTEEPDGLESIGSQRVRPDKRDWACT